MRKTKTETLVKNKKKREREREIEIAIERERGKKRVLAIQNPSFLTFPHFKAVSMRKCLKPGKC